MTITPDDNIVLIGMKHCGKSTLGHLLAEQRNADFYDTDDLLLDLHQRKTGEQTTVRDILKTLGPEGFAALEKEALCELAERLEAGGGAVVALGGRTAADETLHPAIRMIGRVVYLKVPPEITFQRVAHRTRGIPSFLDPDDPEGSFHAIFKQREPAYLALADVTVALDDLSVEDAFIRLTSAITE